MNPIEAITEIAKGQSFPVVLLIWAIYFIYRANKDLLEKLHVERADRLDKLEAMSRECEKDRQRLWNRLLGQKEKDES
jgi:hypothetical protein